MSEHIIVHDEGPVRLLRMNRPEKKNALNASMYDALASALESANTHANIRCMLIAGVPGAFCAGNDLADFQQAAQSGSEGLGPSVVGFLHALARTEKPLVAAVQGVAVGIGIAGGWGWGCGWGGNNNITINNNNNYVNHHNRQNGTNRTGNSNWQHNAKQRGGAPYKDRATAQKYGGGARGDSSQARRSQAQTRQADRVRSGDFDRSREERRPSRRPD